jgi:hypothetical protein
MQQDIDKPDFSITVTGGGDDDSSEYWQEQFQQLYNSLTQNLPEGSIKPLESENSYRRVILFFFPEH